MKMTTRVALLLLACALAALAARANAQTSIALLVGNSDPGACSVPSSSSRRASGGRLVVRHAD